MLVDVSCRAGGPDSVVPRGVTTVRVDEKTFPHTDGPTMVIVSVRVTVTKFVACDHVSLLYTLWEFGTV